MADYYPLLAKALANLPSRTAPTTRRAIYERARKALIGQLRSIQPPMPETQIAGEDAALDRAIERLEAEYAAQPSPPPRAPAPLSPRPSSAAAPPKPPPVSPSSAMAARPVVSAAPRATAIAPKPAVGPGASAPMRPSPPAPRPPPPPRPLVPPPARPLTPPARLPTASVSSAPAIATASLLVGAAASPSIAPPVEAYMANDAEDAGLAPPVAPSSPALAPAAFKAGSEPARPVAPGRAETRRRNRWPLVAVALALGAAGAVAAAAYFWRETPQDFAVKTKSEPPVIAAPAGQSKIAERVEGGEAAAPLAAGETPIPTVTVPVAPVPVAPAAASPPQAASAAAAAPAAPATPSAPANPAAPAAPAASTAAASAPPPGDVAAQAPAAAPPTAQTTPIAAAPDSSRAAMLIALANEPQKPTVTLGNAVWSIIPAAAGQPSSVGVRVEIDIPEQKMHATVTIRKNADASLPATHTIDLRATFAEGAPVKGIKDMDLPRLRKSEAVAGDPLSGVRVKINDGYFLVGLTRSDADAARNLDLLATDNWFDFPLLLSDDRIAKLTFEKGAAGDRVMSQALSAWK